MRTGTGVENARVSNVQIGVIIMVCASILAFVVVSRDTRASDASTTAGAVVMGSATQRAHVPATKGGGGVQAARPANGTAIVMATRMSASRLGSVGARPARRALASEDSVTAGQDSPGTTVRKQLANLTTALRLE